MDKTKVITNLIDEYSGPLLITEDAIKKCTDCIISKELEPGFYTLSVINCTDKFIQELNCQYRGIDEPTDVLTFTMDDQKQPDEPLELGDIFLSIDTIKRQSGNWQNTPEQEYLFMLIHGLLHICGWEHQGSYNEEEEMFRRQKYYYGLLAHEIKLIE